VANFNLKFGEPKFQEKNEKSLKKQLTIVSEDDRIIELSLEGDRYKGNEKKFQKSIDKTLKK